MRRMTIAIGLKAADGIVVAADRQESDSYQKTSVGKVTAHFKRSPLGSLIISGAGTASYIDSISQRVGNWFRADKETQEQTAVGEQIEKMHRKFYSASVLPFGAYPAEERPDYSLLVGCSMRGQWPIFWTTEKMAFSDDDPFVAIGIGQTTAKALLAKYYARIPVLMAINLAAYVMYEVKNSVEYCGLGTDMFYTVNDVPFPVPPDEIRAMENAFRGFRASEREHLHYCIGSDLTTDMRPLDKDKRQRSALRRWFGRLNRKRAERSATPSAS